MDTTPQPFLTPQALRVICAAVRESAVRIDKAEGISLLKWLTQIEGRLDDPDSDWADRDALMVVGRGEGRRGGTVAERILGYATDEKTDSHRSRSMACLYLLLTERLPIPVRETVPGRDESGGALWRAAMEEHIQGTWRGTHDGVLKVRARHPEIARQADAASAAFRKA